MRTRNGYRMKKYAAAFCTILLLLVWTPHQAYAEEASVTFGSNWYEPEKGSEFPIGVYLKADAVLSSYHVELQYDNRRLQYVSGAGEADEENGLLIFDGTSSAEEVKFWITFKAVSGGDASLKVVSATAQTEDGEAFLMAPLQEVPIYLEGTDTAAEEEEQPDDTAEPDNGTIVEPATEDGEDSLDITKTPVETETGMTEIQPEEESDDDPFSNMTIWILIKIVLGILLVFVIYVLIKEWIRRKRIRRRHAKKQSVKRRRAKRRHVKNSHVNKNHGQHKSTSNIMPEKTQPDVAAETSKRTEKPVIRVDNVTMKFKVATNSVSGLKDYVIQKIKKQISVREFTALDGVSFDVFKGEVVGIIGTNGAGKSTLLKIVSGALTPTEGCVAVDKKKIQLLSLGAGFDSELSARENVYLNGAIIGYSKKFIDEHYDEIVEFAELEGFMDEKVKNFSSGMVSRLGFAIATVGDAAEILILDEVLSVGDEFFRKKSLARVKEMIHSGSTVLMVSHGMGTIMSNCTKVVWIEKGKLQMVGDTKIVCAAYRRQFE